MATCGSCKATGVSVDHVKACYAGPKIVKTVQPMLPVAKADLPDKGYYTVQHPKLGPLHFFVKKAKSGKVHYAKSVHGPAKKYLGVIFQDGTFKAHADLPADKAALAKTALGIVRADPVAAAVLFGKTTGHCGFCHVKLTVPASVAAGCGPDCAANHGVAYDKSIKSVAA